MCLSAGADWLGSSVSQKVASGQLSLLSKSMLLIAQGSCREEVLNIDSVIVS